ncbi:GNAT family N-acetyltransferase [Streptomyces sp. B1866]|uniref:GNAT family N-acetyltransferase n=1 Tax=Streptomyces sp. B1866 TaxID=3075431 RepID=UPI00288FED42|nr:GNAT family N-acetyltransferase [Streptomyces sp. B1866]MDT3397579.1 GNAT family N-acetyltransferase [Streptomyces sp. B1866]
MFRIEEETNQERRNMIEERLEDYNTSRSAVMHAMRGEPADDERPVHLYAHADDGALAGGLIGHAWGHWLHVELLWVDERWRGSGLGSRLVARAEEIARDRLGCVHARVESWGFQAPAFYEKLGYRLLCVIPDYPPGETDHLLVKELTAP